jgi:ligand-binding SRPBCC domain-containing protein
MPDVARARFAFMLRFLMPIYQLKRRQIVKRPISDCWHFFSNPRNLAKITPPELNFVIKTDLPSELYPGLMIEYTVSPLFGIPLTWVTEIVQVNAPRYFADEQRIGPYRLWHHEHFFSETSDGGTEVRDLVTYAPPFGPLGAVINRIAIRPQLERIFDYRAACFSSRSGESAA